MKNRLFSFLTVIALVALIIIRFCSGDASAWISCLNYIGLVIAVCGFLIEFASRYRKNKMANFIKGLLMIAIAIMIIFDCLIVTGFIELSVLANDEIMLWTLLISLPINYNCELLDKIINKQPKKEHTYGTK